MAKLIEFAAKRLLRSAGIATPEGKLATSAGEAAPIGGGDGYPVVLKAQIPAGKRGKAGAIQFAADATEATAHANALIGRSVHGHLVSELLVEQKLDIAREHYLAVLSNPASKTPTVIFGRSGGV